MTVTVSPKYQVVIPKEMREALGIEPGQKWQFIRVGRSLHLVRVKSIRDFYGCLRGVEEGFDREKEWADEERDRLLRVD